MAFLYINSQGKEHKKHSYSAGNLFDQSAQKYFLQKIQGWKEKNTKARFEFGKCLEEAIQWYHEHNGQGAVQKFTELWMAHSANKELEFTKVEKDWATLLKTGTQMIRLYEIRQPSLPIPLGGRTLFQREYEKEVYPNDPNYGEIVDVGKLDIVTYTEPDHPMLPRLDWKPEYGPFRPLIVDIKTSGVDFPDSYGLAAYDAQLRRYSWQSGIRDAALLWFTKKSHVLSKSNSVTLLIDTGNFKAGDEAVIAGFTEDEDVILVANDFLITEMERVQGKKEDGKTEQTKAAKARRDEWLVNFGTKVKAEDITKQRMQFNAGYISIESANEAGQIAARQVVNIVTAWHKKEYPNGFGIRYPKDDRQDPYFRAFVLGDEQFRDSNFVKSDELHDMFDTEEESHE